MLHFKYIFFILFYYYDVINKFKSNTLTLIYVCVRYANSVHEYIDIASIFVKDLSSLGDFRGLYQKKQEILDF